MEENVVFLLEVFISVSFFIASDKQLMLKRPFHRKRKRKFAVSENKTIQGFNGTVVKQALPSLPRGSLKQTLPGGSLKQTLTKLV